MKGIDAAFIIPTLDTLFLGCVWVDNDDLKFFPKFRGTTDLKDLYIDSATMSVQSLSKILSFPRALTSLHLHLVAPEDDLPEDLGTPDDLHRAISQQRASLEFLKLDDMPHPVYIDNSEFPKLEVAEGCNESSSEYESDP